MTAARQAVFDTMEATMWMDTRMPCAPARRRRRSAANALPRPSYGRFLQPDPLGYADGPNWYAYVGGDPVNRVDPTGTRCKVPGEAATNEGTDYCDPNDPTADGPIVVVTARPFSTWEIIVRAVGGFFGGGQGASPQPKTPRSLDSYERRILKCNGADLSTLNGVTLVGFLPPFAYLSSNTDAITLPADGRSTIFLREGNASGSSSIEQMGLIAHEFSHSLGYNRNVGLNDILQQYATSGYRQSSAERSARAFSARVTKSIQSGRCQ